MQPGEWVVRSRLPLQLQLLNKHLAAPSQQHRFINASGEQSALTDSTSFPSKSDVSGVGRGAGCFGGCGEGGGFGVEQQDE